MVICSSFSFHRLSPFSGCCVVPVLYGFAVKDGWKGAIQGSAPAPLPLPARNFPRTAQTGGVGFWEMHETVYLEALPCS